MTSFFVSCATGFEDVLVQELKNLDVEAKALKGAAICEADVEKCVDFNLRLRSATRVWMRIAPSEFSKFEKIETYKHNGALFVDTSGELLSFRGYREETGKAPIRETLAASILLAAGYAPSLPLVDVMCGAGTFVIEAALLSSNRTAFDLRAFAFEKFRHLNLKKNIAKGETSSKAILARDLNGGAIGVARRNSKRAHCENFISFERVDATVGKAPEGEKGLVVANFPYGKRIRDNDPEKLEKRVCEHLKSAFAQWKYAFVSATSGALSALPNSHVRRFENGGIPCFLLTGRFE